MSDEDPTTRLNAHKKAISELRREVAGLREEVAAMAARLPPVQPEPAPGQPQWVMQDHCLSCGKPKGPGRDKVIQCKPCGQRYQQQIRPGFEGTKVLHSTCGYCGAAKNPSVNPQCPKCQRGFKEWKAAQ